MSSQGLENILEAKGLINNGDLKMRDPNRLDNFYENLKKIHKEKVPDWRFGQLISNFQSWYGNDVFYLEENQFMSKLNEFFEETKG